MPVHSFPIWPWVKKKSPIHPAVWTYFINTECHQQNCSVLQEPTICLWLQLPAREGTLTYSLRPGRVPLLKILSVSVLVLNIIFSEETFACLFVFKLFYDIQGTF